jgi:hypothetical protein
MTAMHTLFDSSASLIYYQYGSWSGLNAPGDFLVIYSNHIIQDYSRTMDLISVRDAVERTSHPFFVITKILSQPL